jgi:KaiC/GvpD/RAD55 family RecA-like ATPase
LTSAENFKIPILEPMARDGIPSGIFILIEYEPDSVFYNLVLTLAAGALERGHLVDLTCLEHDPDMVRADLRTMGVAVGELSAGDVPRLRFIDGYSVAIGQSSKEKYSYPSMNISDHSIDVLGVMKAKPEEDKWRGRVCFCDNLSVMLRYNSEKSFIDFHATRLLPSLRGRRRTHFLSFTKGVHSDLFYKSMESLADGILDLKLDSSGEEPVNMLRLRSFKRGPHNPRWQKLQVKPDFSVSI